MKNNKFNENANNAGPDNFVRIWHLILIILCLVAWLTGDMADDYKKLDYSGFIIHGRAGIGLSLIIGFYLIYGLVGPRLSRFTHWFPLTAKHLRQTGKDLAGLLRFKLPEHKRHQGLAGFVQFFGILLFVWLAATGTMMYFFLEPGSKVRGVMHAVKEAHEVGEVLIPLYLCLHIGAVIAHSLAGNHVWKDMFFKKDRHIDSHQEI